MVQEDFLEKVTSEQLLIEITNWLCEYSGEDIFRQTEQPVWLDQSRLGAWERGVGGEARGSRGSGPVSHGFSPERHREPLEGSGQI